MIVVILHLVISFWNYHSNCIVPVWHFNLFNYFCDSKFNYLKLHRMNKLIEMDFFFNINNSLNSRYDFSAFFEYLKHSFSPYLLKS